MARRSGLLVGLVVLCLLPSPVNACLLCGEGLQSQRALREDVALAKVVLYGQIANPRLQQGAPGGGTTELHILGVLKPHADFGDRKVVVLNRYIPILDARNPPRFLVFCDLFQGKVDGYRGRPVNSPDMLKYLEGTKSLAGKDRVQALLYFFPYLAHEDADIATDAFLEFARAGDQEVGRVAKLLPVDKLRQLLVNPNTPPERLGLFGFLLGAAGHPQDAELLRSLIDRPTARTRNALDGLLSGYIQLQPQAGWDRVAAILAEEKRSFTERYAAARVLAFHQNWKPKEYRKEILRGLAVMLEDGGIADLAVNNLREWQLWDLTEKVLSLNARPTHASPVIERAILRYALCCPQPAAKLYVAQVRAKRPDLVREVEQSLAFEKSIASQ